MELYLKQLESIRPAVMRSWLQKILPEFAGKSAEIPESSPFDKPLLYQVSHEFQKLYDYICSQDLTGEAPAAETLIKFKSLGQYASMDFLRYPVILRGCIVKELSAAENTAFADLSGLYKKTEELLFSAFWFYAKTREDIYNIKIREFQNGVFSDESLGMKGAACPSAVMEQM